MFNYLWHADCTFTKIYYLKFQQIYNLMHLYKIILIFFFGMSFIRSYGQARPSFERFATQNVECISTKYGFLIDGIFYPSGNTVFICNSILPLDILLVDSTKTPLNGQISWSGQIIPDQSIPYKAKLEAGLFNGTLAKFKAILLNDTFDLSVSKDLDFTPLKGLVEHGYDDNKITQYWPSATYPPNTPWLFVRPSTSKIAHLSATNLIGDTIVFPQSHNHVRVAASSTSVTLDHNKFKKRHDDFNISNAGVLADSIYLDGCSGSKRMFLFTKAANTITVPIKFIRIGETDDDEILYCPTDSTMQAGCKKKINSAAYKCIGEGPDGTYEEGHKALTLTDSMYNMKFFPSWVSNNDTIVEYPPGSKNIFIQAGKDKICNTKPISKDTFFDPLAIPDTLIQYVNEANKIYNNYGVNLTYSGAIAATIYLNYDMWTSDNIVEASTVSMIDNRKERRALQDVLFPQKDPKITTVAFVKEHDKAIAFAWLGENIIVLGKKLSNGNTLAHEIGHARWGFRHPSEAEHLAEEGQTLNCCVVTDPLNLMYFQRVPNRFYLRHYQWRKIHTGKYK